MYIFRDKEKKESIYSDKILVLSFVMYLLIWQSPIWFYMAAVLIGMLFIFKRPNKREVLLNATGMVLFIAVIFYFETYL